MSAVSACPLTYALVTAANTVFSSSWLTIDSSTGVVEVNKDQIGSEDVKIRIEYDTGQYVYATTAAVSTTNVAVTCSAPTLAAITTPNEYTIPLTIQGATQIVAVTDYLTINSHNAACPLKFSLVGGSTGVFSNADTFLSIDSSGNVSAVKDLLKTAQTAKVQVGYPTG